jgi:hypothetical protein
MDFGGFGLGQIAIADNQEKLLCGRNPCRAHPRRPILGQQGENARMHIASTGRLTVPHRAAGA